jgi:Ca-activated chloride channel family protein
MKVSPMRYSMLLCALLLPSIAASAQSAHSPDKPTKEDGSTIRVDTDLVSIEAAVTDKRGANAGALDANDFVIYEDGVAQRISNFATADVPFNVVIVIDTSGSTRDDVILMKRAARRFLNELRPGDRVAVVAFNESIQLLTHLTSDHNRVERALALLEPGSGTAFYDALHLTVEAVLGKVQGRKAIVVLTDGVDSYGSYTYERLRPELEKASTAAYFLELNTENFTEAGLLRSCSDRSHFRFSNKQLRKYYQGLETTRAEQPTDHCLLSTDERRKINQRLYEMAHTEMGQLADRTGGRVVPVKDIQQLEPAYAQIAAELRTQYSLGYYPSNDAHDGKWRSLRVEIKRPGLIARAKPGYRAPIE